MKIETKNKDNNKIEKELRRVYDYYILMHAKSGEYEQVAILNNGLEKALDILLIENRVEEITEWLNDGIDTIQYFVNLESGEINQRGNKS